MKRKNIIYSGFIYLFLICCPLFASDQREAIEEIKKILAPHKGCYTDNLMEELNNSSTQLKAAKYLFNHVMMDKDYLAAEALTGLAPINSEVEAFLNKDESQKYILKAFEIKNLIYQEKDKIENSINEALKIIENSDIEKIRKTKIWLDKPLPIDRIKYCVCELMQVRQYRNKEIDQIMLLFASTNFGMQEIFKAKIRLSKDKK